MFILGSESYFSGSKITLQDSKNSLLCVIFFSSSEKFLQVKTLCLKVNKCHLVTIKAYFQFKNLIKNTYYARIPILVALKSL